MTLPASAAFLDGWTAVPARETAYKPAFFDAADFEALESLTDILIPADETPGAKDARCAQFIDFVLDASTGYAPETQARWRTAMSMLKKAGFQGANQQAREALVLAMSEPERDHDRWHPAFAAFELVKRETTFAFYTSKPGAIGALDYRGNSYNAFFPACTHPEHHVV